MPQPTSRTHRPIWLALALALGLPATVVGAMLLGGRPLVRDDAALFVYPMARAMGESLHAGRLYLWDPAQYCGLPALACGQTGQLHLLHLLLYALLPWMTALHLGYWLHLSLALAATVWVCRNLGLRWVPACLAATVYAFSGYQAAHLVHYNFITAAAYLPLMLAVLQTALRRNQGHWWALWALAAALAYLASHPQVFLMALTVSLLWLLLGDWRGGAPDLSWWSRLPGLLAGAGVAALLVMPQFLPTLELAREGREVAPAVTLGSQAYTTSYPFRAIDLPRLVLPDLFGTAEANVIGGGPAFHETVAFIGAGALLMALVGLVAGWGRRGQAFLVAVLLLGMLLMWSGNPVHRLLAAAPLLGSFRAMGRWAILPIFAAAVLAGVAIDRLSALEGRRLRLSRLLTGTMLGGLGLALLALWLTFGAEGGKLVLPGHPGAVVPVRNMAAAIYNDLVGWEPLVALLSLGLTAAWVLRRSAGRLTALWTAVLTLGLVLPLWHFWHTTNHLGPRDFYASSPYNARMIRDAGPGRVTYLPAELVDSEGRARSRPGHREERPEYAFRELLAPALGTVYGLSYAEGYKQGLVTPSTLRWWQDAYRYAIQTATGQYTGSDETVERVGTPAERMRRFHQLCAVQYLVTPATLTDPGLTVVAEGPTRVYRYRREHPRAWLVGRASQAQTAAEQLDMVKLRGFDPATTAVVDQLTVGALGSAATASPGTATVTSDEGSRLRLSATASAPALLVLADAWYPGWTVTVDGRAAAVLRTNFATRGVLLDPGSHEVEFAFAPRSWRHGLWLMALGLAALAVMALIGVRPRRAPHGA